MSRQDSRSLSPSRGKRTRWRRIALRTLMILAAATVSVAAGAVLSLRSPAVRQALLRAAGDAVADATGMHLTAGDFALVLRRGELTVDGVELRAAPDAEPVLEIDRARTAVNLGSLLGDRILVRSLRVEGLRADLGAPLPELPETEEPAAETAPPAVDVEEIVLTSGTLDSGPLPADYEMWLDTLRVDGLEVTGSYRDDVLSLHLPAARIEVSSGRRPSIEATLEARLAAGMDGTLSLSELTLEGDGLRLAAAGRAGSGEGQPVEASFSLHAEPAQLLPDLTAGGQVDGTGELSFADGRLDANLRLDVGELPAELLRPMIASEDIELAGTVLEADADLQVEAALANDDPLDRLSGHADVIWRRGDEQLVTASLRPGDGDGPGIRLAFDAQVLPAEAGKRRVTGELRARRWLTLDQGELAATRVDLEVPELATATALLGLPPDLGGFHPAGEIRASVDVEGPLFHPDLRLDADWLLNGESLAAVRANTRSSLELEGPLGLAFEAELLPASPGRRRLAGQVWADDVEQAAAGELAGTRFEDARLDLEIPDLAAAAAELRATHGTLFPDRELPSPLAEGSPLAAGKLTAAGSVAGPVLAPRLDVALDWRPAAGEHVHLELAGDAAAEAPYFDGQARMRVADLDAGRFAEADTDLMGILTANLDFDGDLGSHRATLDVEVSGLRPGDGLGLERLVLAARSDGSVAEIETLTGTLTGGQPFSGQGRFELALLPSPEAATDEAEEPAEGGLGGISAAELRLELPRPIASLERLIASLELDGGTLVTELAVDETGDEPRPIAVAQVTLDALAAGAGEARVTISGLELEPFLPLLELDEGTPRPQATANGSLAIDLADPAGSSGTIEITDLAVEGPEANVAAVETLRLELADRRLELQPARLLGSGGGTLEVRGRLELAPDWRPGDDPATLPADVTFDADGSFETSVLDPLLAGARASGELEVMLEVRGTATAPVIKGRFAGPGVELFSAVPYVTRIQAPVVALTGDAHGTSFTARALLNGGEVKAVGNLDPAEGLNLTANFADVRYRVDYGLATRFAGNVALNRPAGGPRSRLTGEVTLERGSLRNDVVLDRETLAQLLAPDLTSAETASANQLIDLDLAITTAHGVSIKNNLGDLRADWSRLRVRGTLQNPVISGRVDVDPGGKLTAYGQTLRIDEASIDFSGDSAAPRVVIETTSSLEDPSVKDDRRALAQTSLGDEGPGSGGFWQSRQGGGASASDELTTGIVTHLGDRAAGSLGRSLARTELSLEPLQIFGETDTTARLTATQQISAEADLVYSVNPRDAEGQTYILELHDADLAPSLTAQLFTNDEDNAGITLQQTLQLGAGRRGGEQGRRLGGTRIQAPQEIDRRQLKRAIGLRKKDPFPEDAEFNVEADAIEALRRQGYPGAAVRVEVETEDPLRPVLDLTVDPGPKVSFVFEGTRPAGPARRSIVQAYQPAAEEVSLEELRSATVTALRGEGYLDPRVEVTAGPGDGDERQVRIIAEGGRRVALGPPELEGLKPEVAELVTLRFESQLSRVELAMAFPGADRYLLQSLAAFGHPRARIVSRSLSDDGQRLTVRIEPGRRLRLARVEILGLPAADAERLAADLPVREGDPMHSERVTQAAYAIEDELHRRGHAQATVRTSVEPLTPSPTDPGLGAPNAETAGEDPGDLRLRFEVDAGPIHRIAGMRLEGLRSTDRGWATRLADLEPGEIYHEDDVGRARRRLMGTGLFEGVLTRSEQAPAAGDPNLPADEPTTERTLIFDFDERARYLLSYGGRWESGENLGVVVDAVDLNFLGRGTTMGVRAIYAGDEDRSLRLYHAIPRIIGPRTSLELFLEGKDEELEGLLVSGIEFWTQLTFPLGPRTRNRFYFRYQDLSFEEAEVGIGQTGSERIPSIGWQLSYDTRDRALGALRPDGLFTSIDLVASHGDGRGELRTDVSALGVFSQLKLFHSFAELQAGPAQGYVTWAQSFRVGIQEPFDDAVIPATRNLRAGGEYSVRGYRRDSLGPLDGDEATGGELFFIVNQELRFPVLGEWLGGLIFFDAGNVWADREALDSELATSAGVGLRAATPAGPLRLDVAFPLDRRPGVDDDVKVYLGFGHVF